MVFSTTTFILLFLPAVLLLYYFPPVRKRRKISNFVLSAASLFFYAWGEPVFVFVMLGSIIMNWLMGLLVEKYRNTKHAKAPVITAVIINIALLFVFKYLTFLLENFNLLFNKDINTLNISLPIGISFFTFQAMSYVIDVYRGRGQAQKNPLNVVLYISFFPQLIAGPIVRYETVAEEINNRVETFEDFSNGVYRFLIGLSKKVLLANNLAVLADIAFDGEKPTVLTAWIGAIAYSLQIYFDFSGYSEMAIGLGRMFGFHFLENFDYPYISKSVTEFWRRWHMSLGTWFRDYVYIPLGGSRVNSKSRLVFNLFVTWTLTGIWHGANWTFLVWGLLYFVLLTVEKLTGLHKKAGFFGHIYTMLFVVLGWVLFRAESISAAADYIASMFGAGAQLYDSYMLTYLSSYKVYFIAGIIACFPIYRLFKDKINSKVYNCISAAIIFALFILSLSFMVKGAYNPFIYFNF
ncbi:MAG: MBOAT family protein [Clostridia bacterium]|nr:MBOAT family protein [Clostridia bacterium]